MTLSRVMSKYKAICLALEATACESANTDARIKALSFLRLIQAPTLIVSIVVAQFFLSFSHPLSLSLLKTSCDFLKAYENAQLCKCTLCSQRQDHKFSELWKKASTMAAEVNIELTKPRAPSVSRNRANAGETMLKLTSGSIHTTLFLIIVLLSFHSTFQILHSQCFLATN